jgi:hypothetical protein
MYAFKSEPRPQRSLDTGWISQNSCSYVISELDVSSTFNLLVAVRSPRRFHALEDMDDGLMFSYEVLPPKASS